MTAYWVKKKHEEAYDEWLNRVLGEFSDTHDDDVAMEEIALKLAVIYGALDRLIYDDYDGITETVTVEFSYDSRTFRRVAEPNGAAPEYICTNPDHRACTGCDVKTSSRIREERDRG